MKIKPIHNDNANYIYYRNLFLRFLKENYIDIYNNIKNNIKTLDNLNNILKNRIPEHFTSDINLLSGKGTYLPSTFTLDYLTFLSENTLPKHRKMAQDNIIKILEERKIDIDVLNDKIKNHRNNLNFPNTIGTIFDDKHNKNIEDVTINSPIALIIFYTYRFHWQEKRLDVLCNDWMYKIAPNIYYYDDPYRI